MTDVGSVALGGPGHEELREFLVSHPRTLLYATAEFGRFLCAAVQGEMHYLVARTSGRVSGVLPFCRRRHPEFGSVINSLPWYGSHGGCVLGPEEDASVREALLRQYVALARGADVFAATLILSPQENPHRQQYVDLLRPDFTDGRIGQMTALPDDGAAIADRLSAVFQQKTRNLVRKSLKQGFSVVATDEDWAWRFLHQTHAENMLALGGRAKPWEHFAAVRAHIPQPWRNVWVASLDASPVAAVLLLSFNRTVEYITPVIRVEYRSRQPLSCLIYHAMLDAVGNGFRWWNWGGTWLNQDSLHHFKAGWGASDVPYSYFVHISPAAVASAKQQLAALQAAFPFFYLLPYDAVR